METSTINEARHRSFRINGLVVGDSTFQAIQHGWTTGDGPLMVRNVDGSLPLGLSEGVDYWAIIPMTRRLDGSMAPSPDVFQLAASPRNALDRVAVAVTTPGTGYHLIGPRA
jgi:hypothetical protein